MLDLSSNQLKLIQDGSFNFISTLISLNLANTSLSSLDKDSLSNLVLLKNLNLSENKLDSIPTNQLRNQRKLNIIDLSNNMFKVLSPHAFRQLEALQVVNISHCPGLLQIQAASFHNNLDLHVVDLSNNPRLSDIQPHAFPRILHIQTLLLSYTGLTSLHEDAIPWNRLIKLDLSGTRMVCSCQLAWLTSSGDVTGGVCSQPSRLAGTNLSQITTADLGCGYQYSEEVIVVAIVCAVVLVLALGGAVTCCLLGKKMRNLGRMRNLAPSCTLAAREQDLKSSYDNCLYVEKNYGLVGSERLGLIYSGMKPAQAPEKEEFKNLRVPEICSTQL